MCSLFYCIAMNPVLGIAHLAQCASWKFKTFSNNWWCQNMVTIELKILWSGILQLRSILIEDRSMEFSNSVATVPMILKTVMIKTHNTGHRNLVDKIMKTYKSLFKELFRGGNNWYVHKWRDFNTQCGGYSWASVYVLPLLEFSSWL